MTSSFEFGEQTSFGKGGGGSDFQTTKNKPPFSYGKDNDEDTLNEMMKLIRSKEKNAPPIHILNASIDELYDYPLKNGKSLPVKIEGVKNAIENQSEAIISAITRQIPGVSDSSSLSSSGMAEVWKKFGKRSAKKGSKTTFNDVVGNGELKQRLKNLFLDPLEKKYKGAWNISSGIQLAGLPGVGKTMSVDALVAELEARDMAVYRADVQPSNLLTKYVGDSEKLVKDLFHMMKYGKARKETKTGSVDSDEITGWEYSDKPDDFKKEVGIIFIDETESLAPSRTDNLGTQYSGTLTNQLLMSVTEVTKANIGRNVIVFLASNFPDRVDTGLSRRVQNFVYVDLPSPIVRQMLFLREIVKWMADPNVTDPDKKALRFATADAIDVFMGKYTAKNGKPSPRWKEFQEKTALLSFSDIVALANEFTRFPFNINDLEDPIIPKKLILTDKTAKKLYAKIKRTVRVDEIARMIFFQKHRRAARSDDADFGKLLDKLEEAPTDWEREKTILYTKIHSVYERLADSYEELAEVATGVGFDENDIKKAIRDIIDVIEEYPILSKGEIETGKKRNKGKKDVQAAPKTPPVKKNESVQQTISSLDIRLELSDEMVEFLSTPEKGEVLEFIARIKQAISKLGENESWSETFAKFREDNAELMATLASVALVLAGAILVNRLTQDLSPILGYFHSVVENVKNYLTGEVGVYSLISTAVQYFQTSSVPSGASLVKNWGTNSSLLSAYLTNTTNTTSPLYSTAFEMFNVSTTPGFVNVTQGKKKSSSKGCK